MYLMSVLCYKKHCYIVYNFDFIIKYERKLNRLKLRSFLILFMRNGMYSEIDIRIIKCIIRSKIIQKGCFF